MLKRIRENRSRNIFIITLVMVIVVVMYGVDLQAKTQRTHGVFKEGVVTQVPWEDERMKMKVDQVVYFVLSQCRVFKQSKTATGAYIIQPAELTDIQEEDQVSIKVQGNRVSEIIIYIDEEA